MTVTVDKAKLSEMSSDRVQHMLPQNMAHQHVEYFKLKEFEETAEAGRSL